MQNTTYQIIPFNLVLSDETDSDAGAGYPSALGFNGNYNQPKGSVTRFSANCTVAAGAESSKTFLGQSRFAVNSGPLIPKVYANARWGCTLARSTPLH